MTAVAPARWPLSRLALKAFLLAWAGMLGWWAVEGRAVGTGRAVCPRCGAVLGNGGR